MKALFIAVLCALAAADTGRAPNFEQWNTKPPAEQLRYLSLCVDAIADSVGRHDAGQARRIKEYFSQKEPGAKFSEGTAKLVVRPPSSKRCA